MLMWRASNSPSRENIEGESDGPNEIEMLERRTGGQRRDSRTRTERRGTDEDIVQFNTNTLAITPLTRLPNKRKKVKKKKRVGGLKTNRL